MDSFRPLSSYTAHRLMTVWRQYFRPEFIGLNQLDLQKPAIFVGNHTLYGLLDVPLMIEHFHVQHGVFLRSLGDRAHFKIPLWRDCLVKAGTVPGSPENCDALMRAGESILVFPGGAREVWRRKGEQYTLIWKNRLGFVRQAIKHGYDIIPFGALGADECFTIVADANDIQRHPKLCTLLQYAGLNELLGTEALLPPLSRGIGSTPFPRPQRFYFGFGDRISTTYLKHCEEEQPLWALRNEVADAILQQIARLKQIRHVDRIDNWSWLRQTLAGDLPLNPMGNPRIFHCTQR